MLHFSNPSIGQRLVACAAAGALSVVVVAATASGTTVSISSDVLSNTSSYSNVPDGTQSATAEVNYVAFIPNAANPAAVQYDFAGNTVNVGTNIYNGPGAAARGGGQGIEVNGYGHSSENGGATPPDPADNLYLTGQDVNTNNPGFGAHANWVVTVNLDTIRSDKSLGNGTLNLSGLFGSWGSIGDKTGGIIQGEVLLDGTRVDSMGLTSGDPNNPNNQSFNLSIPSSAHELSFLILNGNQSSLWDDGLFENVNLSTPEPASLALFAGVATMSLARRRKV